jgi:hypothetical protein
VEVLEAEAVVVMKAGVDTQEVTVAVAVVAELN